MCVCVCLCACGGGWCCIFIGFSRTVIPAPPRSLLHPCSLLILLRFGAACSNLTHLLHEFGVTDVGFRQAGEQTLDVFLNGVVVGEATLSVAQGVAQVLRELKALGEKGVPAVLEIALIPPKGGGVYPGE